MEGRAVGYNFERDPPRFGLIWFSGFRGEDLNEKLKYFYAEAKPKLFENCAKVPYQSNAYNRRSMNNVRAALNRH
jgi:hypothetical protein